MSRDAPFTVQGRSGKESGSKHLETLLFGVLANMLECSAGGVRMDGCQGLVLTCCSILGCSLASVSPRTRRPQRPGGLLTSESFAIQRPKPRCFSDGWLRVQWIKGILYGLNASSSCIPAFS